MRDQSNQTFKEFLMEGYRNPKTWRNRAANQMGKAYKSDGDGEKYKEHYLSIPYSLRNEAKKYGAQWDGDVKKWYVIGPIPEPLKLMIQASDNNNAKSPSDDKIYLNVPYKEKDQAKKYGAKWDSTAKSWYYPGYNIPMELEKWRKV